jgi:predicted nuclease of predicted toxin-antitoxin system
VAEFRHLGFEAEHVGDLGMAAATDQTIIEYARRTGHTVVTLDADFHAILALSNAALPSVIRLRVQRLRGEQLAALVARVIGVCATELNAGALVTIDEQTVRVRVLPLVRER